MSGILFIDDTAVAKLLSWPLVSHAVEQALRSVCRLGEAIQTDSIDSVAQQPVRSFTPIPDGVLLTMPGYIGNYAPTVQKDNRSSSALQSSLGCKLVTSFKNNARLETPLPSIIATIMLFDTRTGVPKAILGATEITTWRTVAASLVATKYIWFGKQPTTNNSNNTGEPQLAIVGCGVQGRMHAIGMVAAFKISSVKLWNRTQSKADDVATELRALGVRDVRVVDAVEDCVRGADIIVVATNATAPLITAGMLKKGVHINAIGANLHNHHSELDDSVYAQSAIYVDAIESARSELADLGHPIRGQVGDVILGRVALPATDVTTVFQSMGMAVEDVAVAQAVLDLYNSGNNKTNYV